MMGFVVVVSIISFGWLLVKFSVFLVFVMSRARPYTLSGCRRRIEGRVLSNPLGYIPVVLALWIYFKHHDMNISAI